MSEEVFEVTIKVVRNEEKLTSKQWVIGGPDNQTENGEYGYSPQVVEITEVRRELVSYQCLNLSVPEIMLAVLENSMPISGPPWPRAPKSSRPDD